MLMNRFTWKLVIGVALIGTALATGSCSDDSGNGAPDDPDIAEGEAILTLTGDAKDSISADGSVNVMENSDFKRLTWTNGIGNQVQVTLRTNLNGTGSYDLEAGQGGDADIVVTYDGNLWTPSGGGSLGISTNNDNRIAGVITDVKLSPQIDTGTVTINGKFNALVGN